MVSCRYIRLHSHFSFKSLGNLFVKGTMIMVFSEGEVIKKTLFC